MEEERIRRFINEFQAQLLTPIQEDLAHRKNRMWRNDLLSATLEEILCSLSVLPKDNGEFDIAYLCREDIIHASYNASTSISHMEHCLFEIHTYLKLYELQGGLLPLGSRITHLIQGINKLLQIVNPKLYGNFN